MTKKSKKEGKREKENKLLPMPKSVKIKEPNTLIEAKQRMSRDEMVVWLWSLVSAKFYADKDGRLITTDEEIEKIKKSRETIYAVSWIDLNELAEKFPDYFTERKLRYYREIIKGLERKIVFEVNLTQYLKALEMTGFGYLKEELGIPNPEDVYYYGVATVMSIALTKDGRLQIVYTPHIAPLLVSLKKWFTLYDFEELLKLKSKHSAIFYRIVREKLGLRQNPFRLTVDEIRTVFSLKKRSPIRVIRDKILSPAVEEINSKTSLRITFKPIRRGRGGKIIAYEFKVFEVAKPYGLPSRNLIQQNLKQILSQLNLKDEEGNPISIKKVALELYKLERVNPAVAIWFLLHYPEGEARLYAWKHIQLTENSRDIKHPDKFLESLIKDKNPELDWLLDQRTKDLIYEELKKIAGEEFQKQKELEELVRYLQELEPFLRLHEEQIAKKLNVKHPINYVNQLIAKKDVEKLKQVIETIKKFLSEKSSSQDDEEFFEV